MKTCDDCPFVVGSKNTGSPDWLKDVFGLYLRKSTSHSCHKTDPIADGYIRGKRKDCNGIKMIEINEKTKTHIHKNVYKNFLDFFETYIQKYKFEGLIK